MTTSASDFFPGDSCRPAGAVPISTVYQVAGMSCGHCGNAVIREVAGLAGVSDVRVDLAEGSMTVVSDRPMARSSIGAAIEEAGCTLA